MIWSSKLKESGYKAYGISFGNCTQQGNIITPLNNNFEFFPYEKHDWDPKENYHGASLYSPDVILQKNDKEVVISLQGVSTRDWDYNNENLKSLSKNCKMRYICFKIKNEILFETWSGETPPEEIINKFI